MKTTPNPKATKKSSGELVGPPPPPPPDVELGAAGAEEVGIGDIDEEAILIVYHEYE